VIDAHEHTGDFKDPVTHIGDNHADDVPGATALGCREYELRDLIAAVRA
jgi:hypothetical protein